MSCNIIQQSSASEFPVVSHEEFCLNLRKCLRRLLTESNFPDERTCLLQSMKDFEEYACRYNSDILEFIFSVFEIYRSTDSVMTWYSLEHYILNQLDVLDYDKIQPPNPFKRHQICDYVEDTVPGNSCQIFINQIFYRPITLTHSSVIERLLRYGLHFNFEGNDLRRELIKTLEINLPLIMLIPGIADATENNVGLNFEMDNIGDFIDEHYSTAGKLRRLYFVCLAVQIIRLKLDDLKGPFPLDYYNFYTNLTRNIKMAFKTIPDPFISIGEIYRFFEISLKSENKAEKITMLCSAFAEDFPKSTTPLQPRTLQHLCRIQVRDSLATTTKLPHGVWSLPIPDLLKNYILLQRKEDDFYPFLLYSVLRECKRTVTAVRS